MESASTFNGIDFNRPQVVPPHPPGWHRNRVYRPLPQGHGFQSVAVDLGVRYFCLARVPS
jgi:hypothetical protein